MQTTKLDRTGVILCQCWVFLI